MVVREHSRRSFEAAPISAAFTSAIPSGMNEVDAAITKALAGYSALTAKQAVIGATVIRRYQALKA